MVHREAFVLATVELVQAPATRKALPPMLAILKPGGVNKAAGSATEKEAKVANEKDQKLSCRLFYAARARIRPIIDRRMVAIKMLLRVE